MLRRVRIGLTALVPVVAVVLVVSIALAGTGQGSRQPAALSSAPLAVGDAIDKKVPHIPLVDEHGHRTSLAAFRGRYVVMAPSLTLCHEVCPMTTAALMRVRQTVDRAGLASKVAVVEVTVDPWRDSPARLRAYQRLTGADIRMLTGTKANIARLWKFFGIYYQRVAQGHPPDVDWLTHKPERFDVNHTDGLMYLDPAGHWRITILGMPTVGGRLSPRLRALLNDQGQHNLAHPRTPWTVGQAVDDLYHLMGRPVTAPTPSAAAGRSRAPTPARARAELAGSPAPLGALHAQAAATSEPSARGATIGSRSPISTEAPPHARTVRRSWR